MLPLHGLAAFHGLAEPSHGDAWHDRAGRGASCAVWVLPILFLFSLSSVLLGHIFTDFFSPYHIKRNFTILEYQIKYVYNIF